MTKRRPIPLYHWSPISRRVGIQRYGLKPGCLSRDGDWRAPYVCLADSPSAGWALSGALSDLGTEWDLWMVWSNALGKTRRRKDGGKDVIEYRVFERVPKRHVWWVGSRTSKRL